MDDIRRPAPQRRDYALGNRGYTPRPATPDLRRPVGSVPPAPTAATPTSQLAPQAAPAPYEQPYAHYTAPAAQPVPAPSRRNPLKAISLKYAVSGLVIVALVAAAGFMLTRPPKKSGFTVAELAKKANFGFFYPQPLPPGYTYEPKFNAVQDGQVYFMLAKGGKHIVIHEQPANGKLDLSSLTGARKLTAAGGQAGVGIQADQPAAKAMIGTTLISVNSTGGVPQDDLVRILNLLKSDR